EHLGKRRNFLRSCCASFNKSVSFCSAYSICSITNAQRSKTGCLCGQYWAPMAANWGTVAVLVKASDTLPLRCNSRLIHKNSYCAAVSLGPRVTQNVQNSVGTSSSSTKNKMLYANFIGVI